MRHATPIRPVRQIYHKIDCPQCGWYMHPDGKCTHCRYDYATSHWRGGILFFSVLVCGTFLWAAAFYAALRFL